MNVFSLQNRLTEDYSAYIRSFISIRDARIGEYVELELKAGLLWPEPMIQLNPSFEPGCTIDELVSERVLHPECAKIFQVGKDRDALGKPLRLHRHQEEAIRAAVKRENYVLTTGTGSGKSLAYLVPIVDHVLRKGSGKGVRAIIVYPMNALANSQMGELDKFINAGYPVLWVACSSDIISTIRLLGRSQAGGTGGSGQSWQPGIGDSQEVRYPVYKSGLPPSVLGELLRCDDTPSVLGAGASSSGGNTCQQ